MVNFAEYRVLFMSKGRLIIQILAAAISVTLFVASCSRERAAIPEKTVAEIMQKMWLADQYYLVKRDKSSILDSVNMYASIIEDYGYTIEDYRSSVSYYLTRPHGITDIIKEANNNLKRESERLAELVETEESMNNLQWSGKDTIENFPTDSLLHYPGMRSLKWLCYPLKLVVEPLQKLDESDIPANRIWWENNIRETAGEEIQTPYKRGLGREKSAGKEKKADLNPAEHQTDEDDNFPSDAAIEAEMKRREQERLKEQNTPNLENRSPNKVVRRYNKEQKENREE